jgi:DNA processing protein
VYPPENKKLADSILDNGGLLMSEYAIGMGVNRYNLVARDRLQAGLADATIVIQTGIHGGTMHAVNATLQAGKPLFVVEYSKPVLSDKIQGNKYLKESKGAQGISAINTQDVIKGLITSSTVGLVTSTPKEDDNPNSPIQLELFD